VLGETDILPDRNSIVNTVEEAGSQYSFTVLQRDGTVGPTFSCRNYVDL
jgi:hypothetical protein